MGCPRKPVHHKAFARKLSRSGRGLCHRILAEALPLAWRKLQDQPLRMRGHTIDDIAQVHERIDLQVLAGLHE